MSELDPHAKRICATLLKDLVEVNKGDSSIKFFRQDLITMVIWLYIMESYSKNIKINIEDVARGVSQACRISKPSLRLILENAKAKGFIKFTQNLKDNRSWIIEPEDISINEFNAWTKKLV